MTYRQVVRGYGASTVEPSNAGTVDVHRQRPDRQDRLVLELCRPRDAAIDGLDRAAVRRARERNLVLSGDPGDGAIRPRLTAGPMGRKEMLRAVFIGRGVRTARTVDSGISRTGRECTKWCRPGHAW